jgi:hypothetical protein
MRVGPMNKKGGIIGILVIVQILSVVIYIGDLRCEDLSNNINEQYQSKYVENTPNENRVGDVKDDKNAAVKILEWIIKRNLSYKYSQLDPEELEEKIEKRSEIGGR